MVGFVRKSLLVSFSVLGLVACKAAGIGDPPHITTFESTTQPAPYTVTWQVENATACEIRGNGCVWGGEVSCDALYTVTATTATGSTATSGSIVVTPKTFLTMQLTCHNADSQSVTDEFNLSGPGGATTISSFKVQDQETSVSHAFRAGTVLNFTWVALNAAECRLYTRTGTGPSSTLALVKKSLPASGGHSYNEFTADKTFVLGCFSQSGLLDNATPTATSDPLVVDATVAISEFTASKTTVTADDLLTLTFNALAQTSCTLSDDHGSTRVDITNQVSCMPATGNNIAVSNCKYKAPAANGNSVLVLTLTCTGNKSTDPDTEIKKLYLPYVASGLGTLLFTATPSIITTSGGSSTLVWNAPGAAECKINAGASLVASGTQLLDPSPTVKTTYTIKCSTLNDAATCTVNNTTCKSSSVIVDVFSFASMTPLSAAYLAPVTITATVNGAVEGDTCTASGLGDLTRSGTTFTGTGRFASTTTVTVTCTRSTTSPATVITKDVTVTVAPATDHSVVSLIPSTPIPVANCDFIVTPDGTNPDPINTYKVSNLKNADVPFKRFSDLYGYSCTGGAQGNSFVCAGAGTCNAVTTSTVVPVVTGACGSGSLNTGTSKTCSSAFTCTATSGTLTASTCASVTAPVVTGAATCAITPAIADKTIICLTNGVHFLNRSVADLSTTKDDSLTLTGSGSVTFVGGFPNAATSESKTILDGRYLSRIMTLQTPSSGTRNVTIKNMVFRSGRLNLNTNAGRGGCLRIEDKVSASLENVDFIECVSTVPSNTATGSVAGGSGGAIYLDGESSLSWRGGQAIGNQATDWGAVLLAQNGSSAYLESLNLRNNGSSFTTDVTGTKGGGAISIWGLNTAVTVVNTLFQNNGARVDGGAISLTNNSFLDVSGCIFRNNNVGSAISPSVGGAIGAHTAGISNPVVRVAHSLFESNNAYYGDSAGESRGGAIGFDLLTTSRGSLYITDSRFVGNISNFDGGALYLLNTDLTMDNSVVQSSVSGAGGPASSQFFAGAVMVSEVVGTAAAIGLRSGGGLRVQIRNSQFLSNVGGNLEGNDGNGGALFLYGTGMQTTIEDSIFENNASQGNGGAIVLAGLNAQASIGRSLFRTNTTRNDGVGITGPGSAGTPANTSNNYSGLGGAIFAQGAISLNIFDSEFSGNRSYGEDAGSGAEGGVIYGNAMTSLKIARSIFAYNRTEVYGGAIRLVGTTGTLEITDSDFWGNSLSTRLNTGKRGLAIHTSPVNAGFIRGSTFRSHVGSSFNDTATVDAYGGTVSFSGVIGSVAAPFRIEDTRFEDNVFSNGSSAGIASEDGGSALLIQRCTFARNSAGRAAAIMAAGTGSASGILSIVDSTFIGNTGNSATYGDTGAGGALHLNLVNTPIFIEGSLFQSNTGRVGGAINLYNNPAGTGTTTIRNSTFLNNRAYRNTVEPSSVTGGFGGAISVFSGTHTIVNNTFANNIADSDGGAIYQAGGTVNILLDTFVGNSAKGATAKAADVYRTSLIGAVIKASLFSPPASSSVATLNCAASATITGCGSGGTTGTIGDADAVCILSTPLTADGNGKYLYTPASAPITGCVGTQIPIVNAPITTASASGMMGCSADCVSGTSSTGISENGDSSLVGGNSNTLNIFPGRHYPVVTRRLYVAGTSEPMDCSVAAMNFKTVNSEFCDVIPSKPSSVTASCPADNQPPTGSSPTALWCLDGGSTEQICVYKPIKAAWSCQRAYSISCGGTSWNDAFTCPSAAVAAINKFARIKSGTTILENYEIWVKKGTYQEPLDIALPERSAWYGGFVGNETALYQRPVPFSVADSEWSKITKLSADHMLLRFEGNPDASNASLCNATTSDVPPVPQYRDTVTVDGFILHGGKSLEVKNQAGGFAIRCASNVTVRNIKFKDNLGLSSALYALNTTGLLTLENIVASTNESGESYLLRLRNTADARLENILLIASKENLIASTANRNLIEVSEDLTKTTLVQARNLTLRSEANTTSKALVLSDLVSGNGPEVYMSDSVITGNSGGLSSITTGNAASKLLFANTCLAAPVVADATAAKTYLAWNAKPYVASGSSTFVGDTFDSDANTLKITSACADAVQPLPPCPLLNEIPAATSTARWCVDISGKEKICTASALAATCTGAFYCTGAGTCTGTDSIVPSTCNAATPKACSGAFNCSAGGTCTGGAATGTGCSPTWTCIDIPADSGTARSGSTRSDKLVDVGRKDMGFHTPGRVWFVDASVSSSGDGKSWMTAFQTLKEATMERATAGDAIWVADGTYRPSRARGAVIDVPAGVSVLGGFSGRETNPSQRRRGVASTATIFDGDIDGGGTWSAEDASHVVTNTTAKGAIALDGLSIIGGNGRSESGGGVMLALENTAAALLSNLDISRNAAMNGGGVYVDGTSASPVLLYNVRATNNRASNHGGGVYLVDGLKSLIEGGSISNNGADQNGGALYSAGAVELRNVVIDNNAALKGGGIALETMTSTILSNVQLSRNDAGLGGGVYGSNLVGLVLNQSTIAENTADQGAMLFFETNTGNATVNMSYVVMANNKSYASVLPLLISVNNTTAGSYSNSCVVDGTSGSGITLAGKGDVVAVPWLNGSVTYVLPKASVCRDIVIPDSGGGVLGFRNPVFDIRALSTSPSGESEYSRDGCSADLSKRDAGYHAPAQDRKFCTYRPEID